MDAASSSASTVTCWAMRLTRQRCELLALLPRGRRVAALEVGAGTGGTASSVLPVLQGSCERYVFTDVSDVFLRQARVRFANFACLECVLLNIDASPQLQGFATHENDLLVATNVLHATPFMRNTLHHCAKLLCEAGMLVVNELLATITFAQMTFGMTDGWWLFRYANLLDQLSRALDQPSRALDQRLISLDQPSRALDQPSCDAHQCACACARVHVCVLSDAAEKESFARQRCCIGGGGALT